VVADLVDDNAVDEAETSAAAVVGPLLVGAAAEAPRGRGLGADGTTRSGDTGELDPISEHDDEGELDPEEMRYAPRPPRRFTWARRLAVLVMLAILVAIVAIAGYKWSQSQFYVADDGVKVAIFRGVEADVPGIQMHHLEESSNLTLADLPTYNARQVRDGISANDLDDARGIVTRLERLALCPEPSDPSSSASPKSSASPSPKTSENKKSSKSSASKTPTKSPTNSPSASPSEGPAVCTEAP